MQDSNVSELDRGFRRVSDVAQRDRSASIQCADCADIRLPRFHIQKSGCQFPGHSASIVDLLRWRAAHQEHKTAYGFLRAGGDDGCETLTYGQLDRKARAIAAYLQQLGARQGDRVIILYPDGLNYIMAFLGCLYAGLLAVPAYPPDPKRLSKTLPRLQAIIDDCQAQIVLSTPRICALLRTVSAVDSWAAVPVLGPALSRVADKIQLPSLRLRGIRYASTEHVADSLAARWTPLALAMETVAFLQYTSGSTGSPKGVMVSHGNLLHNQEMIKRATSSERDAAIVGWVPLYHDMGIIGNVLHALYLGVPSYLMSPLAFLQRPARWLEAVAKYRATFSGGPNFAYALCAKTITDAEIAALDLSAWEFAFSGSEPVRASTIEAFSARFASCGFRRESFYPCYGMADATLLVSGGDRKQAPVTLTVSKSELERKRVVPAASSEDEWTLVGSGQPCSQTDIAIVNSDTRQRTRPGEIGEIWVAGPQVAQGYWNRPEVTQATYGGKLEDYGNGHAFLRTGDLGFMHHGELFVTGRMKDVIIIRGRNLYAHDIEAAVYARRHQAPEIRSGCGAAVAVEHRDGEALVMLQEVNPDKNPAFDPRYTVRIIRRAIGDDFGVAVGAVVLLARGTIPKTSSGKLMRFACRQAYQDGFASWDKPPLYREELNLQQRSPGQPCSSGQMVSTSHAGAELGSAVGADEVRVWFRDRLASLLGVSQSQLDTAEKAADIGLDSLVVTELCAAVETELGVGLTAAELLSHEWTVDDIIATVVGRGPRMKVNVRTVPLSSVGRSQTARRPSASGPSASGPSTSSEAAQHRSAQSQARAFVASKRARIHVRPESSPKDSRFRRFVNPFLASLIADVGLDKRFVRGDGCSLFDDNGVEYLDCIAQYGALPFGYNPPQIWNALDAVRRAGEPSFVQPSILDGAGELAERLLRHAPGMGYVTYANSGAEAVEAAIKLCRSATGRQGILSTDNGFHGKTLAALSATGRKAYQADFGAPAGGFATVPYGDADAVDQALSGGQFAAVILEPIQGEAGIVVPPPGYLREVSQVCRRHGVLLIVDEVQTGLGRTGTMFASLADGAEPDVIVVAKALGGGLMPIGACLCRAEIYNREFALKHSSTFAGNSLACRAGLAVMDLLEADGQVLLERVRDHGNYLLGELSRLGAAYPELVREVRGKGYLIGIELAVEDARWQNSLPAYLAEQGLFSWLVCSDLLHHEHIRVAPTLNDSNVLRIEPALIASQDVCRRLVAGLERTFARITKGTSVALLAQVLGTPERAAPPASTPARPVITAVGDSAATEVDRARRFAFLLHPLDANSLADLDPRLAAFGPRQLADLVQRMHRQAEPFEVGATTVESMTGEVVRGRFIALPHTAEQLRRMEPRVALESVEEALELALEDAPHIVGLGGFSSVVTHGGLSLPATDLPALTSGSALTAIAGEVAVQRAMVRRGIAPDNATIAVIGGAGHVGSALTLLMTEHAHHLIVVGNPAAKPAPLTQLRRTMLAVIGAIAHAAAEPRGGNTIHRYILDQRHKAPAAILDELVASGRLLLATQMPQATMVDVVITATSAAHQFIDETALDAPKIICELSRPLNVASALAGRPDIDYIEGGVVKLPGASDLGFNAGLAPGHAYACMAETMLLALDGCFELPLRGHSVDPAMLATIRALADMHGFHIAA